MEAAASSRSVAAAHDSSLHARQENVPKTVIRNRLKGTKVLTRNQQAHSNSSPAQMPANQEH
jgi:hypothetical protein